MAGLKGCAAASCWIGQRLVWAGCVNLDLTPTQGAESVNSLLRSADSQRLRKQTLGTTSQGQSCLIQFFREAEVRCKRVKQLVGRVKRTSMNKVQAAAQGGLLYPVE
jgi:hypothetical protein